MIHHRKIGLARRYEVTVRAIDYMVRDGRLPPPDFFLGRLPIWTDESIVANERAAAARRPSKPISKETAANSGETVA
jgi:hypothetical protein